MQAYTVIYLYRLDLFKHRAIAAYAVESRTEQWKTSKGREVVGVRFCSSASEKWKFLRINAEYMATKVSG